MYAAATATAIALALLTTPGVPDTGPTVRAGLKWLAAEQKGDGSWEGSNGFVATTLTATAGLALLMEGSTPKGGAYAAHIRKAVEWLEASVDRKGRFARASQREAALYVPSHCQALLFLACAYDADDDPERRARAAALIEKTTAFLLALQTSRGGWGQALRGDGTDVDDCPSTASALQALLAVRRAGIPVPRAATDNAVRHLARATNSAGGIIFSLADGAGPQGSDAQPMVSSMAAACGVMQDGGRPEVLARWVRDTNATNRPRLDLLGTGSSGYALLEQYRVCRVAYALGENGHRKLDPTAPEAALMRWSACRTKLFAALVRTQSGNGKWEDRTAYGPAYSTALALIILQFENNFVPAFAR